MIARTDRTTPILVIAVLAVLVASILLATGQRSSFVGGLVIGAGIAAIIYTGSRLYRRGR